MIPRYVSATWKAKFHKREDSFADDEHRNKNIITESMIFEQS